MARVFGLNKAVVSAAIVLAVFSSCKKENKNPEWDVNILSPIFKATLTVKNILADTLYTTPDGRVNIIFTSNGYSPPVDSLFQFHDTLIASSFVAPVTLNIAPGTPIYSANQTVALSIPNGVQLKTVIIKKGFAHFIARNKLQTKVNYAFVIPGAISNGNPFSISQSVNAAPAGGVTVFDGTYDMTGYTIDLTGPLHTLFNTLTYNVNAYTDSAGITVTPLTGDTVFSVFTGFKSLVPLYGKGYLGQGTVTVTDDSADVGFTKMIQGGTIVLDSISASIDIKNYVGADAQAEITSFQSINGRTGITVPLNAPTVINHTININRATETLPPPHYPLNYTYNHLGFDQTNSNIIPFLENIPSKITYSLHINFNPLGPISGGNDFIYTDSLFDTKLSLNFPFRFGANQLIFTDTVNSAIKDTSNLSNAGSGNFTLVADNGFPWEMQLQISLLDESNHVTDNIIVQGTITAAPLNSSMRAVGKVRSTLTFPVDEARKQRILSAKQLITTTRLTTSAYPQPLQVYSDYELDIRLIGDMVYHVR
jgi:hypothetical protein